MPGVLDLFIKQVFQRGFWNPVEEDGTKLQHFDTYRATLFNNEWLAWAKLMCMQNGTEKYTQMRKPAFQWAYTVMHWLFRDRYPLPSNPSLPEKTILALYQKYGTNTPEKINGDYNIVINDPAKTPLLIFNDVLFQTSYLYDDQFNFYVCPGDESIFGISCFWQVSRWTGHLWLLNFSYHMATGPCSKMSPYYAATCLQISPQKIDCRTYWQPRYTQERRLKDINESTATGYQLSCNSMQRKISDNNHCMLPLSADWIPGLSFLPHSQWC